MTTEMPPLKFAMSNGIRMGYYEAGPVTDTPPLVLCHGWPEMAFSWRHQIKALAAAGIRVIAPDQRGCGATVGPDAVEGYDIVEHLSADLVGLLDHLKIEKAIFVGHDWGGFIVWQMPLRHPSRVAGVIGVNTPHTPRAPVDPIQIFRKRFGERMYIVQFQDPAGGADAIFERHVEQTFDCFMRKPMPQAKAEGTSAGPSAGIGGAATLNLAFPQIVAAYNAKNDPRTPILSAEEMQVFIDTFKAIRLHRRHQLVPQHDAQLGAFGRSRSHRARAGADDDGRERRDTAAFGRRWHGEDRAGPGEVSGQGQRPLDAAGKAGRGEREDHSVAANAVWMNDQSARLNQARILPGELPREQ